MLGQFLEYSVAARPLAASFDFYRSLGFASIPVSDTLPDPYLVFYDGAVAVGLHDREQAGTRLTFVRPGLRDYVRALRRLDIELDYQHLTDNEFHSLGFTDPSGQEIALIEARTFPPGDWDSHNVAACGAFFELTLPAQALDVSCRFWQALGFIRLAAGEAPHRWQRLTGHGLNVGLHETHCAPGLSFRCPDLAARTEYLRAKGLTLRMGSPLADRVQPSATLTAPEGTLLYLFESGAQ
jgi:catechol 2,3-dioxygenase-like lactoylglutathione lyase family enzyme